MTGIIEINGTALISSTGNEYIIATIPPMDDVFILSGIIDLSKMPIGSVVTICIRFKVLSDAEYTSLCADYYYPRDAAPVIIKPLFLPKWSNPILSISMVKGSEFSVSYWVAAVRADVGIKSLIMRRFA